MKKYFVYGAIASAFLLTAGTAATAQNYNNPGMNGHNNNGMNNQTQGYSLNTPGPAYNSGQNEEQPGQNGFNNNNNNARMTENEIKSVLRDQGYSNFQNMN